LDFGSKKDNSQEQKKKELKMVASRKSYILFFLSMIICTFIFSQSVFAHSQDGVDQSSPKQWMEGYTLIVTDAENLDEAYQAQEAVERKGGHIALILSNRIMTGWVSPELAEELTGKYKILGIYHKRLTSSMVKGLAIDFTKDDRYAIRFFNKVVTGKYQPGASVPEDEAEVDPSGQYMLPDMFEAPPVSYEDYMKNLEANGITEEALRAAGVQFKEAALAPAPGNSDYMAGKVLFYAIFVESNGSIDPNEFTWTAENKETIQDEIRAGLSWWAYTARNRKNYNTPLGFVLWFNTKLTSYEPIRHPSGDDYLWINEIMASLGYGVGDKFARTTAFNTANRISKNTNWAVVSFIAYNPSPAPSTFTNGYFAYAYLRGPYSQLCFRNNGWAVGQYDVVNAHETGHLFGASDEYYQAGYGGCTTCGRVANNVFNGNCEYCQPNAVSCIMRNNAWELCGYTPGQLGWRNATDVLVSTYDPSNGKQKNFFAPGEAIQYKVNFCIEGPRLGSEVHTVRVRYKADFFTSFLDTSSTVADDTGWGSWTGVTPPTSTGKSCWVVWWNRNVPAEATYGNATVSVQFEIEGLGRQAWASYHQFYVGNGAATTTASPVSSPYEIIDDGPYCEPAPLTW